MIANANKRRKYEVHILHTDITAEKEEVLIEEFISEFLLFDVVLVFIFVLGEEVFELQLTNNKVANKYIYLPFIFLPHN